MTLKYNNTLITQIYLVSLVIILLNLVTSNDNIISVEYQKVVDRISYGIKMKERPFLTVYASIDMQDTHSYYSECENITKILGEVSVMIYKEEVPCTIYQTELELNENDSLNFKHYYPNIRMNRIGLEKGVGFGFEISTNDSFISQLKAQNKIDKVIFSIVPKTNSKGLIYLGGLPEKIAENKSFAICKVIEENMAWGCQLNSIMFQTKNWNINRFPINQYGYFQSSGGFVMIPKWFAQYLNETFFNQYLENKKCKYHIPFLNYYNFECNCDVFDNYLSISFVFDNYHFNFSLSQVVAKYQNRCDLLLYYLEENEDKWVFGSEFLINYISTFDSDNKQIIFYSNSTFQYDNNLKIIEKNCQILLIFLMIIGLINVFLFIYSKEKII